MLALGPKACVDFSQNVVSQEHILETDFSVCWECCGKWRTAPQLRQWSTLQVRESALHIAVKKHRNKAVAGLSNLSFVNDLPFGSKNCETLVSLSCQTFCRVCWQQSCLNLVQNSFFVPPTQCSPDFSAHFSPRERFAEETKIVKKSDRKRRGSGERRHAKWTCWGRLHTQVQSRSV